jgi:hypothetical protein
LDEHRALSREMQQMARRMRALCELIVGVYGPHSRAAFSFLRAMEDVEHLNQELNTQATHDGYPGTDMYL